MVGGGKMGEALVGGLLAAGWAEAGAIEVVEPDPDRRAVVAARFPGIRVTTEPGAAAGAVIAVKPGYVAEVAAQLGALAVPRILSIAAGVRLATIEAQLPSGIAVIRAMPNTPALVGQGAAAIAGGAAASAEDLDWAEGILAAVGTVVRVGEEQLDAVTGLSGSGPAYVFLVVEAMIDAGVLAGLPRPVATELVVQTLRGSAELLAGGTSAADLRAAVTSPGGTTAAGIHVLEAGGVRAAVADAVMAATRRSAELG